MKTVELIWIENKDDDVANKALTTISDLVDCGVFPDVNGQIKDGKLVVDGPEEQVDKLVLKLQKDFKEFGNIAIKENKQTIIPSFNENVQDIFNHIIKDFSVLKETKIRPKNYVSQLNDLQIKFMKFKKEAVGNDKKIIQSYINEVQELLKKDDGYTSLKPIKESNQNTDVTLDSPIRDWYVKQFPTDSMGKDIVGRFRTVIEYLLANKDVYDAFGAGDSVIRERIFEKLSEILNVDYDDIYELWLNNIVSEKLQKALKNKL